MRPRELLDPARRAKRRRQWSKFAVLGAGTNLEGGGVRLGASARATDDRRVTVGDRCMLSCNLVLETAEASITVGDRTFIGYGTLVDSAVSISIGNDVLISFDCLIFDHDSHPMDWQHRMRDVEMWRNRRKEWAHVATGPVSVGDRAWVGARSIILKGVVIGEGAVVGAGSVVTKNVPPGAVVAGAPARVIRQVQE